MTSVGDEIQIKFVLNSLIEIIEKQQIIIKELFDEIALHSTDDLELSELFEECEMKLNEIKERTNNKLYVTNNQLSGNWEAYRYK